MDINHTFFLRLKISMIRHHLKIILNVINQSCFEAFRWENWFIVHGQQSSYKTKRDVKKVIFDCEKTLLCIFKCIKLLHFKKPKKHKDVYLKYILIL